jgi:hypothetical protein
MASPARALTSRAIAMTIKAAMKGYIEGIHFIHANKQASQKVFAKYMRTNDGI